MAGRKERKKEGKKEGKKDGKKKEERKKEDRKELRKEGRKEASFLLFINRKRMSSINFTYNINAANSIQDYDYCLFREPNIIFKRSL
jgi:superfamily I DNA and/or RNA helicase